MRKVYHGLALLLFASILQAADLVPLGQLPKGKTFLVILAHHDDHTWEWGFGGFIARLADAGWTGYYVRTTNDEKDGNEWGPNDIVNLREAQDAARHLGMKGVISLNWRNDHMSSAPLKEVRAQYILLIRKYRPDVLMSWDPWGHYDRNPDHKRVARAVGEAVWMAGLANVHPEHLAAGLEPFRVPQVYYTQREDYGKGHTPNIAMEFNQAELDRKTDAFWSHKNVRGTPASPEARRLSMETPSREAGKRAGVAFAELFYAIGEWDDLPGLKEYLQTNARPK
ncbi:MAG: PIG-L family deacetylase [Bryobacterales bacterium]|nr:PIG-L family deacetylase [Bryobacterales bacterium]